MPKVRRSKKRPPEGWELIEPTLDELDQKMREGNKLLYALFSKRYRIIPINAPCFAPLLAETETHEGKRRVEALWPIFK